VIPEFSFSKRGRSHLLLEDLPRKKFRFETLKEILNNWREASYWEYDRGPRTEWLRRKDGD
jgi:hypothetical protein